MPAAVAAGLPETTTPWLPAATLGPCGAAGFSVACGQARVANKRRETAEIEMILSITRSTLCSSSRHPCPACQEDYINFLFGVEAYVRTPTIQDYFRHSNLRIFGGLVRTGLRLQASLLRRAHDLDPRGALGRRNEFSNAHDETLWGRNRFARRGSTSRTPRTPSTRLRASCGNPQPSMILPLSAGQTVDHPRNEHSRDSYPDILRRMHREDSCYFSSLKFRRTHCAAWLQSVYCFYSPTCDGGKNDVF